MILLITVILIILNNYISDDYISSLNKRWQTIKSYNNVKKDMSFIIRRNDIKDLINDKFVHGNLFGMIFGRGLGDRAHRTFPNSQYMLFIDNSYFVLIWKTGIIGFTLFWGMIFHFLLFFWKQMRNRSDNALAIAGIGTILSLILYMLGTNIAISYRFITLVWGTVGFIVGYYEKRESLS